MVNPELHFQGNLLILSDSHLSSGTSTELTETEIELIRVLDYCEQNSISLLLLGDTFDYWMEYPGKVPNIAPDFRNRLQRFAQYNTLASDGSPNKAPRVVMITGNHDNWTRDYFPSIGIPLYHETLLGKWPDRTALFLHGDGLKDPQFEFPRPLFHRFLRHPVFVTFYQAILPETVGLRLMKWFSEKSRLHSKSSNERLDLIAKNLITNGLAKVIICGHDHLPRRLLLEKGLYLNCGSFHEQRTAVFYTNGEFELVKWEHHQFVSYH